MRVDKMIGSTLFFFLVWLCPVYVCTSSGMPGVHVALLSNKAHEHDRQADDHPDPDQSVGFFVPLSSAASLSNSTEQKPSTTIVEPKLD